jgi:hypothetical protein
VSWNSILKVHDLFWQELLLWHLELHKTFDLTHLQVFRAQPVLQLHLAQPCPFPIDCKRAASRTLISVFEWTSASDKTWKVDDMNWFLGKVEFSSPCLVPSLYCWVSEIKYVTKHILLLESPRPLSTLGIDMATLSSILIQHKVWLLLYTIISACFDKLLPLAIRSLWIWFDFVQSSHVYLSCSFVWNRVFHIVHSCS